MASSAYWTNEKVVYEELPTSTLFNMSMSQLASLMVLRSNLTNRDSVK